MQLQTSDPQTPAPAPGTTERVQTAIIGGGQAGLAVGYALSRRGVPFLILDANERTGEGWRRHWDSLHLYNPARYCSLPGMRFPAPDWSFPGKDAVADYLEDYAERFRLPIRRRARVRRLRAAEGEGGFVIESAGGSLEADNVVVATGTWGKPYLPAIAAELDPEIRQLHSSEYRNPGQLAEGPVLVVGASHSGAEIALDVAACRETVLCGRDTGEVPVDLVARARVAWPIFAFVARRVLTIRTPLGRKLRAEVRSHGGELIRARREELEAAGVRRCTERATVVAGGRPQLADGEVIDAANVIWCTGFRQDWSWIELPVIGEDGWPEEERGAVPSAPGLYFMGLPFQHSFGSMLLAGVGRDAEHVAKRIQQRGRGNG